MAIREQPVRRGAALAGTVALAIAAIGCASSQPGATPGRGPKARLERAVARNLRAHPAIPGEAVSVRAPDLNIAVAAGLADRATRTLLTPTTPFRIASVTKTFVAVALLRQVEQGRVSLDEPIGRYLRPETTALLRTGGYAPERITVRMLLGHTAGLFDYASSSAYDRLNVEEPGRRWTADDQVAFAMEHGRRLAPPGEQYHYSDTGYVLLGEILQRVTGQSLASAVRESVGFERLGLDHTWWEQLEPPRSHLGPRAHQYYGATFDNGVLDASSDLYGSGGLISTVGDLSRFFRALFEGEVFEHDRSLDAMVTVSGPGRRAGAALGIFARRIAGERCYGHAGYWGTEAYACPGTSVAFALTVDQADESLVDTEPVLTTIVRLARQHPGR